VATLNQQTLRLTHTGLSQTSILITDLVDGLDGPRGSGVRKPGPVYVPVSGFIDLVFTDDVAMSYQSGVIATFIQNGYLTAVLLSAPVTQTMTDLYVDKTGDDGNDGSVGNPVLTFKRLMELIPNIPDPTISQSITIHVGAGQWDESADDVRFNTFVDLNIEGTREIIQVMPPGTVVSATDTPRRITFAPDPGWAVDSLRGLQWRVTAGQGSDPNAYYVGVVINNGSDWVDVLGGPYFIWGDRPDATSEITFYRPATKLFLASNWGVYNSRAESSMTISDVEFAPVTPPATWRPATGDNFMYLVGCRFENASGGVTAPGAQMNGCYAKDTPSTVLALSNESLGAGITGCLIEVTVPTIWDIWLTGNTFIQSSYIQGIGVSHEGSVADATYSHFRGPITIDGAARDGLYYDVAGIARFYGPFEIKNCGRDAIRCASDMYFERTGAVTGAGNAGGGLRIQKGRTVNRPSTNFAPTGALGDFSTDWGGTWQPWASVPYQDPVTWGKVI